MTAVHLFVIPRLFRSVGEAPLPRAELTQTVASMRPLRPAEWTAALAFLFFVLGSATVGWHHVKPAYLAGCVLLALLVTGTMLRKDFRSAIDWPQIFFLLGLDSMVRMQAGLPGSTVFTGHRGAPHVRLHQRPHRGVHPGGAGGDAGDPAGAAGDRRALTSTVILLPIAIAQGINPWICVFCAAIFSDIAFFRYQGTNGMLQLYSEGLIDEVDRKGFLRYTMVMNGARVAAVFASIPWWGLLGLA